MTRIFISAGLRRSLRRGRAIGPGPRPGIWHGRGCAREAGGEVLFDYKDYSVMGFVEVVKQLPRLFALNNAFKKAMDERKPDVFVTVDYPDFNMRVAKVAESWAFPYFHPPVGLGWQRGQAKMVAGLATQVAHHRFCPAQRVAKAGAQ